MTTKWPVVALETLCNISLGKTPSRGDKKFWDPTRASEIVWMSIADLPLEAMTEVSDSKEYLTPEGAALVPIVPQGTLIMSFKLSVGRTAIAAIDLRTNEAIAAFNSLREDLIDKRFLGYFLGSQDWAADQEGQEKLMGVTLNKAKLRAVQVPLPPLDEQKRIVAKLDAAQEEFNHLNDNLEQQLSQLTDFDSALLSEMLGEPFQTPDPVVTTKWPKVRLGDFVGINPQKSEARKLLNSDDPVSFFPMEDLGVRCGEITPVKQRRFGDVQSSYTYFRDGDVLLAKITPCFENGKLGIARNLINGVGFGSSEYLVIRPSDLLMSEYVYYAISQNEFIDQGKRVMTGSVGHKRVPKEHVSELQIPLPPLDEQKRIVAKLDEASLASSLLRSNILDRKKSGSDLQSSILTAAFAGAL